jgi:pimeloyl-ACP methyl ester carboxylesterase
VRSLCVIEPVAFHLLRNAARGDRALLHEVAAIESALRAAIATETPEHGMARFIDFWNGNGSWTRLEPDVRSHLCGQIGQVVANFAAIANESSSLVPVRSIGCPTTVIRAERSPAPARRIAKLLSDAIPGAVLADIPGAGHMAPLTHPQWVDPLVANHIAAADSDAALGIRRQFGMGLKPAA